MDEAGPWQSVVQDTPIASCGVWLHESFALHQQSGLHSKPRLLLLIVFSFLMQIICRPLVLHRESPESVGVHAPSVWMLIDEDVDGVSRRVSFLSWLL